MREEWALACLLVVVGDRLESAIAINRSLYRYVWSNHYEPLSTPDASHRGIIFDAVAGTPGAKRPRSITSGTPPKPHIRPPPHSIFCGNDEIFRASKWWLIVRVHTLYFLFRFLLHF